MSQRNARLVRFFARASLLDLAGTFVILLSTLLLNATPVLAGPFSELVCRELTRGELFRVTSEREGRAGGKSEGWGRQGVDVVAWGVETCEESWRWGALILITLLAGLLALKAWGIWATWEFHSALVGEPRAARDAEWCEDKPAVAAMPSRTRALSTSKPTRSRSAPTVRECRPHSHGRCKPTSASQRPRLVLVPVFFESTVPRTTSPSTYSPPTTPTFTSASAITTSTDSASPARAPRHPRRYSAPPPPSMPRTLSPPALPASPPLYPTTPIALDEVDLYLAESPAGSRRSRHHSASVSSSRRSTDSEAQHEKQV